MKIKNKDKKNRQGKEHDSKGSLTKVKERENRQKNPG
jgi:hypothetical protein